MTSRASSWPCSHPRLHRPPSLWPVKSATGIHCTTQLARVLAVQRQPHLCGCPSGCCVGSQGCPTGARCAPWTRAPPHCWPAAGQEPSAAAAARLPGAALHAAKGRRLCRAQSQANWPPCLLASGAASKLAGADGGRMPPRRARRAPLTMGDQRRQAAWCGLSRATQPWRVGQPECQALSEQEPPGDIRKQCPVSLLQQAQLDQMPSPSQGSR